MDGQPFRYGNVMQFGYPQDWIQTLGSRIKRIHVKDYKLSAKTEQGHFVPLFEGDVDFKAAMQALVAVDYHGFLSPVMDASPGSFHLLG
jgi:L-ribulose-5-phosphate 3-epimerase